MSEEKSNFFSRTSNFFSEVKQELGKVTWPTRDELYGATFVIIVVIVILCTALGLFDSLISFILTKLILPAK